MTDLQQLMPEAREGELFQLLVENVKDYAIFVLDPQGRVRSWNPGAARLLGYSEAEIIGRPAALFFTPGDVQEGVPEREMEKAMETGREEDTRWHLRKNGSRFWSAGSISPLWDEGRTLRGFAKIMRDHTAQKQNDDAVKDALAYAQGVVETVREPLLVLTGDLRVKTANRSFYQTFRVSAGETESRLVYHLGNGQWDIPSLRTLLEEILPRDISFDGFEVEHEFGVIGRRVMLLNARRLYREDNSTELILLAFEDVTDRRRAEEARRETETNFTSLVKNVKEYAIFTMDRDGRITSWNVAAERMLGYAEADILGQSFSLIFTPEDIHDGVPEHELNVANESGQAEDVRWHIRRGGERFWAVGIVTPTRDATGRQTGFSKILRDMTEQKLAEKALERAFEAAETRVRERTADLRATNDGLQKEIADREAKEKALQSSEARYRTLVAATAAIVWNTPASGQFNTEQPGWTAFTGLTFEQLRGWGWLDAVHPEDRDHTARRWKTAVEQRTVCQLEHRLCRADGVCRRMSVRAVPLFEPCGAVREWVGVHTDIHEHRQAEIDRNDILARLQLHIERMPLAYISFDADRRITDWNPAAERIFGYAKQEAIGLGPLDLVPASFWESTEEVLGRIQGGDMGVFSVNENVTKDGRTIACEWHNTPLLDTAGKFTGFIVMAQDVTGRREAEKALRLRDRAIQSVTQGILITDCNRNDNPTIYASPKFLLMTGYCAEEVIGRNCRFLQGKDTDPAAVARIHQAIRQAEPCTVELLNYRKDGTAFWNELSIAPVTDPDGRLTHFVGVQTDVTQRRQLEDQLRQAQKMEAFGQLAGGVAHDFNNLLTIISGYSEMVLASLRPEDQNRAPIQAIQSAGERATLLTRQLLAFSRKQVVQPRILDLNAIVVGTERMLGRLIGEDVSLRAVLASGLDRVKIDPGQAEQVIMNLVVNARDSMPLGGEITIETANADLDETCGQAHAEVQPGRYVVMAVSDTGCGMTEEVKRHIFEPFFTTKEIGKGTGLGLATVFGIVKQWGGHVWVYSEVGRGTTFKIYLPSIEEVAHSEHAPQRQSPVAGGTETILLVEDEEAVRKITRLTLQTKGYRLLEAGDGGEAIRLCEQHPEPIHLLISDVVMPRMGGRQLAARLIALHPEMRVLFVSGYTDDAVMRHGVVQAEVQFLQKPFSVDALSRKVRAVLDGPD